MTDCTNTEKPEKHLIAKIYRGGSVVVIPNPSQSEIREVASKDTHRIRFTADARSPKKVWVWDASKAVHYQMLPLLGTDRCDVHPYILGGVVELQQDDAVMIGWDNFYHLMNLLDSSSRENVINFFTILFSYDWTWLGKYFSVEYIDRRRLEFQQMQQETVWNDGTDTHQFLPL